MKEEYKEHHSAIVHCRFSASGKTIASADADGIVKYVVKCECKNINALFILAMLSRNVDDMKWQMKKETVTLFTPKLKTYIPPTI